MRGKKVNCTPIPRIRHEDEPPEAVGREHDVHHAIAWLWRDHSHDGAGCDRGYWTFRDTEETGQLFRLGPGIEQSGTRKRGKGITKEGRRELRWALVEAAQRAVKSDPHWKRRFQELEKRMQRNQAIVVVARRLLELVWYVLTRRQAYRHFSQERIAYKYLTWGWQMDEEARDGLARQQFARYYLMRLGIGHDLTRVALNPKYQRRLASEAELLALRPEFQMIE
jgi:hypothetical protein